MVTLAPFMRGARSSREDALSRAFAILLTGIGQNVARMGGDEPSWKESGSSKEPDAALLTAGSAVETLNASTLACQQRYEDSLRVWRDIVRILLRYVDQTAPPADISAGTLALIDSELDKAVKLEQINALRARIEACIAELAENAALSAIPMAELKRMASGI